MKLLLMYILIFFSLFSCNNKGNVSTMYNNSNRLETAILGGGCFWCVEAIFQRVEGVISVESGYCGGKTINPTYEEVCTGTTGHAEVCKIVYDKDQISYEEILQIFFAIHDPTTLNRQGNDIGTQYRSAIFYIDDNQRLIAEKVKNSLDVEKVFDKPIVTEITPVNNYFKAEEYHQDYFKRNPNQPYCAIVIQPKLEKFLKKFKNKLKQ